MTDDREKIKAAVTQLNEAMENWRKEPEEGRAWTWDQQAEAGSLLADAAEALIVTLPADLWPASWFKPKPTAEPGHRPVSAYEERLIDELLEYLDR
ncbi:hypothetical protein LKL35_26310 [Streptomyces sp. ET3-23]|uniref:hypothetical protein n=1 Tax=Streptomyces sp. ET3-23 TaxID=2885643 RepID=UPI001D116EC6|nr:hypothetical protein [Streptomyces sp. ET3-23]MCC2278914.1 hypothetical protein [Streptomyces sp. ET3-23]